VGEDAETFDLVVLYRLKGQGPHHPSTMVALHNLMHTDLQGVDRAPGSPALLPEGANAPGIRLDGDLVDQQVDLVLDATALQEDRTERLGPDDPRTMAATSYLAYALAFADHIDGQIESALVLAQDAYEGLDDAAAEGNPLLGPYDVQIATLILAWINEILDQSAD